MAVYSPAPSAPTPETGPKDGPSGALTVPESFHQAQAPLLFQSNVLTPSDASNLAHAGKAVAASTPAPVPSRLTTELNALEMIQMQKEPSGPKESVPAAAGDSLDQQRNLLTRLRSHSSKLLPDDQDRPEVHGQPAQYGLTQQIQTSSPQSQQQQPQTTRLRSQIPHPQKIDTDQIHHINNHNQQQQHHPPPSSSYPTQTFPYPHAEHQDFMVPLPYAQGPRPGAPGDPYMIWPGQQNPLFCPSPQIGLTANLPYDMPAMNTFQTQPMPMQFMPMPMSMPPYFSPRSIINPKINPDDPSPAEPLSDFNADTKAFQSPALGLRNPFSPLFMAAHTLPPTPSAMSVAHRSDQYTPETLARIESPRSLDTMQTPALVNSPSLSLESPAMSYTSQFEGAFPENLAVASVVRRSKRSRGRPRKDGTPARARLNHPETLQMVSDACVLAARESPSSSGSSKFFSSAATSSRSQSRGPNSPGDDGPLKTPSGLSSELKGDKNASLIQAQCQYVMDAIYAATDKFENRRLLNCMLTAPHDPVFAQAIKYPLLISTIKSRIDNQQYASLGAFELDFKEAVANIKRYWNVKFPNGQPPRFARGADDYDDALQLASIFRKHLRSVMDKQNDTEESTPSKSKKQKLPVPTKREPAPVQPSWNDLLTAESTCSHHIAAVY